MIGKVFLTIAVLMVSPTSVLADWQLVLGKPSSGPESRIERSAEPELTAERADLVSSPECYHVVIPGDTLSGIARARLGAASRWKDISALNRIENPARIHAGLYLRLPADCRQVPPLREMVPQEQVVKRPEPAMAEKPQEKKVMTTVSAISDDAAGAVKDTDPVQTVDVSPAPVATAEPGAPYDSGPGNRSGGSTAIDAEPLVHVWEARSGESLMDVIARWALTAGYTPIIQDRWSWQMDIDYAYSGSFRDALVDLLSGFPQTGRAPVVTFFSNKVLSIGK